MLKLLGGTPLSKDIILHTHIFDISTRIYDRLYITKFNKHHNEKTPNEKKYLINYITRQIMIIASEKKRAIRLKDIELLELTDNYDETYDLFLKFKRTVDGSKVSNYKTVKESFSFDKSNCDLLKIEEEEVESCSNDPNRFYEKTKILKTLIRKRPAYMSSPIKKTFSDYTLGGNAEVESFHKVIYREDGIKEGSLTAKYKECGLYYKKDNYIYFGESFKQDNHKICTQLKGSGIVKDSLNIKPTHNRIMLTHELTKEELNEVTEYIDENIYVKSGGNLSRTLQMKMEHEINNVFPENGIISSPKTESIYDDNTTVDISHYIDNQELSKDNIEPGKIIDFKNHEQNSL